MHWHCIRDQSTTTVEYDYKTGHAEIRLHHIFQLKHNLFPVNVQDFHLISHNR